MEVTRPLADLQDKFAEVCEVAHRTHLFDQRRERGFGTDELGRLREYAARMGSDSQAFGSRKGSRTIAILPFACLVHRPRMLVLLVFPSLSLLCPLR